MFTAVLDTSVLWPSLQRDMSQSEAIRSALLGEVRHLRRSRELAGLEADETDRAEMLAVAEMMEALTAVLGLR